MNWKTILKHVVTNHKDLSPPKVFKSPQEWKTQLTPEQFQVTRLAGTERPFTGEHCTRFEPGLYDCVCCQTTLFDATQKFDSGTGWPSFTKPVGDVIAYIQDDSMSRSRIETVCANCHAHLGHVFPDGPEPTGLRFCINSVAISKKTSHP